MCVCVCCFSFSINFVWLEGSSRFMIVVNVDVNWDQISKVNFNPLLLQWDREYKVSYCIRTENKVSYYIRTENNVPRLGG